MLIQALFYFLSIPALIASQVSAALLNKCDVPDMGLFLNLNVRLATTTILPSTPFISVRPIIKMNEFSETIARGCRADLPVTC